MVYAVSQIKHILSFFRQYPCIYQISATHALLLQATLSPAQVLHLILHVYVRCRAASCDIKDLTVLLDQAV